jgi:two-component system, NtrC family, sensor kinase
MSILPWNNQLLVGIDSVDQQHQQLVKLINKLDEVVTLGQDPQLIVHTVNQLVDYTRYHFQHEEALMRQAQFNPQFLAQHCQQHQDFIDKIQTVQNQAQTDVSIVSKDLLDFLVDWLCHHTLKTDKLMALSLKQGIDAAQISLNPREPEDILHSNLYSALRESEERFRELADNLQALIWVTNAKNLPIFCNSFWFKAFGLKSGRVTQDQWLSVIHADDRQPVMATYQKAATELNKFKIEYRLCLAEGKTLWILETAVPRLRKNGSFAGLMGCGMDISSQKRAEARLLESNQQLEQRVSERTQALVAANQTLEYEKNQQTLLNQQLQEAQLHLLQAEKMASIGQLAAGVAHEINNPLGYIHSNLNSLQHYIQDLIQLSELSERLAQQLPDTHPELQAFQQFKQRVDLDFLKTDAEDLVKESLEGTERARKIVQNLRDFSRIDNPERELFNPEAGMDATLNIVHNELKYKAEVIKEYAGLQPIACVGGQINQVFTNLLVNAAQAISEFGKIYIRTGYQDPDWLWIEVQDTGCGMDEATRTRIFDPFFTTKPVGKGTGLGLSLSYKIIKDHHGRIEVDSVVGQGTRFRLYLPTSDAGDELP